MPGIRLIKKYPNRRLYDTELSRYITLANIRELVIKGISFKVVDTSSNGDLTRSILLQIMLDEESRGEPLFSPNMLAQIIRFHGGTSQGVFARYLEESLTLFVQQQEKIESTVDADPTETMSDMAENNIKVQSEMQRNFFKAAGFTGTTKK
ncbi:MAG: polyhydroxyalkanoate synthesis repressor PhaR [Candidatus Sedimenticola sp. (ex Thyasira tokunagai)]